MRLNQQTRRTINKILAEMGKAYYEYIPIKEIDEVLRSNELKLVQEDGTDWSGILCGTNEITRFNMATLDDNSIDNSFLVLSWYKMPSGRYEIVGYLS